MLAILIPHVDFVSPVVYPTSNHKIIYTVLLCLGSFRVVFFVPGGRLSYLYEFWLFLHGVFL